MSHPIIEEQESPVRVNLLMLPVGLVVCAIIGAIAAYISYNYFSLIIIFPLVMGVMAGVMAQKVIHRRDGKRSWWGSLLAILFALFVYGVYRYGEYYLTFEEFGDRLKAINTFRNYLDWSAAQGMNISRTTGSSSGVDIEGQGVWIFWGIEFLITLVVAFFSSQYNEEKVEETEEIE